MSKSRNDFLSERVINYWNNLPPYVKVSTSVDMFKCNLEAYKLSSMGDRFLVSTNCFWEVSEHIVLLKKNCFIVLNRIETPIKQIF